METNYLNLPIGRVLTKELKPWFQWIGRRDYDNFASFPGVVGFFTEINKPGIIDNIERSGYFQENELVEPSDFLEEKILFFVRLKLYNLFETSATMLVKFFCDGTVETTNIYVDDSESNELIDANMSNIDKIVSSKEESAGRMSWKEFIQLFEEIEAGSHNVVLKIPEL